MDETDGTNGLAQEIKWLRGAIREMMQMARGSGDLEQMAKVLSSAGTAITRLGQALKLQRELVDEPETVEGEIRQALLEIGEKLKK
jgi:hypothetical protein